MRTYYPERFAEKVQYCTHGLTCPTCCWPWRGSVDRRGWGRLRTRRAGCTYHSAHRYAWALAHGAAPTHPVGHSCDLKACVNPAHLTRPGGTRRH